MGDCLHPPNRLFAWYARDDGVVRKKKDRGAGSGQVLCVACCDCGQVLEGGVPPEIELPKLGEGQVRDG
jgi:hypothetical protein